MAPSLHDPLRGRAGLSGAPDLAAVIRATGLLPPGARVLVAVSGGPDSLALLHALYQFRGQPNAEAAGAGLHLVVAHVDHCLRPDSAADATRVAELARAWNLPFVLRSVEVRAVAASERRTLEEAGREARYRFFAKAAAEHDCSHVVLGHTADDQAETVLLNLLRGTGLSGLAGMPAARSLQPGAESPRLVRPLLGVRREEVLAYCRAHGLEPALDPSNESPEFTRNRIRRELLPHLAEQYNPRIVEGLARLATTVRDDVELRDTLAAELLEAATWRGDPTEDMRLDLRRLRERPRGLAVAALRLAFTRCAGRGAQLDHAATRRIGRLLFQGGDRVVDLLEGWSAWKSGPYLTLLRPHREPTAPIEEQPLTVPGMLEIRPVRHRLEASLGAPPVRFPPPRDVAYLDADAVRGSLRVRGPQPGDRIRPLGMEGSKKVSALFGEARIPRPDRTYIPLVVDEERILWVVGCAIHHDARVTAETRRVLVLRLTPLAS